LGTTHEEALTGIRQLVAEVSTDMQSNGEVIPEPLSEKHYSGEFRTQNRALA
jgi:predicted RNase H-like HicB family nuclease